jgi:hypothetical protein
VSFRRFTLGAAWRYRKAAIPIALTSFVLPPRRLPERPIMVIGCPRSGTTLLFRLLRKLPGVVSIGAEGHPLWETFHHPRGCTWRSSALGADDVGGVERRYVAWTIALVAGRGRFVDKTPRNALRLPYLDAMFPDATFVYLYRDGRRSSPRCTGSGCARRRAPPPDSRAGSRWPACPSGHGRSSCPKAGRR